MMLMLFFILPPHKVPMIDDLHKKVLEARELRAERFAIRRQQDVQDELDECKGQ